MTGQGTALVLGQLGTLIGIIYGVWKQERDRKEVKAELAAAKIARSVIHTTLTKLEENTNGITEKLVQGAKEQGLAEGKAMVLAVELATKLDGKQDKPPVSSKSK